MATISVPKRISRSSQIVKANDFTFSLGFLAEILYRIPAAVIVLIIIFLWCTSTTIISGNIVHVCLSSRKLNLYCISAGTQPKFDIPTNSLVNGNSILNSAEKAADEGSVLAIHSREKAENKGMETLVDDGGGKMDHLQNDANIALKNSVSTSNKVDVSGKKNHVTDDGNIAPKNTVFMSNKVDGSGIMGHVKDDGNIVPKNTVSMSNKVDGSNIMDRTKNDENIVQKNAVSMLNKVGRNGEMDSVKGNGNIKLKNSIPIFNQEQAKALTKTERRNRTEIVEVESKNAMPTIYEGNDKKTDEELAIALMDVKDQIRIQRSWISSNQRSTNCDGRGVYVYDLPSKFNKDILVQCNDMIPWADLCNNFSHDALGEPIQRLGKGWYQTHQYALEPIFHSRVLKHPCKVYNQNEAKLFYVPYYGGLEALRWHFKNVSNDVKDSLSQELIRWLETQYSWNQNSGKDHFFVLGKISWDFRRNNASAWGTKFLELDEMQNPIKLLIEKNPWHVNDISIPHPTYFHPQTDNDIITWQQKIISSYRRKLVSFAGGSRPDSPNNIRSILIQQCISMANGDCKFLDCNSGSCDQPETLIELFTESEFCLQPPGDSATRKSVFDSLISGCIPVFFDPFTAHYQYPWHLPEDHENYSVFIDQDEVRNKQVSVAERLVKITKDKRDDMRRYIVYELLPRLVYADSNSKLEIFQDAFSVTMNNLIERMNKL
ncbi:OLC1v1029679C2 [Oldenlandia corymbosa var. corymbosa]|nr:OLC1v1029679C2 [Oldenlandia corymbosa var. corymbosa]